MKTAVVNTLHELARVGHDCAAYEFTGTEWGIMEKVVRVLEPFEEATRALSEHGASISMAIPYVTLIMNELQKESAEDVGVLTMKRALHEAMTRRFSHMEQNKWYMVSTLLDSRYKHNFYRDPGVLELAKDTVLDELVDVLRSNNNNSMSQVRVAHNV